MHKIFLILFSLCLYSTINAQNQAENALQNFTENFPQEKIHVLLNKKFYVTGESIFFKCFVMEGYKPTTISSSLFVELYDNDKKLIKKKLVPIFQGESDGNLVLPADLKENVYYLRFYTTWMTNFSDKFQYVKPIPIYNSKSTEKLILDENNDWHITIHPESGKLISNMSNNVAVRMHAKGELPSKWKGTLIETDHSEKKITEFNSLDENVGIFTFSPISGKSYQLIAEDEAGNKKTMTLPLSEDSGVQLQVKSENGEIEYSTKFNQNINTSAFYHILGQMNNQLVYKAKIPNLKPESVYKMQTDKLVNGILQLTLFNDKDQVIAERLCFVDAKKLNFETINLQEKSLNASPKSDNSFKIPSKNNFINYSVFISDNAATTTEDENSLLSTLWLTGDISSKISNPAQYFLPNSNKNALDALLITEKWERFDWSQIISGNFPKITNQPVPFITYSGKASLGKLPAKNADLNLIFTNKDKGTQLFQVKTDNNGFFTLKNMIFDQPFDIHYTLNSVQKNAGQPVKVVFQNQVNPISYRLNFPSSPWVLSSSATEKEQSPEVSRAFEEISFSKNYQQKVTEIEAVVIKKTVEDKTEKLNNELSSSNFQGINETVFDFVNDNLNISSGNIFEWLQGKVAGLQIRQDGMDYIPTIRGLEVGIFVDEFPSTSDDLKSISINDVAMIKVIKPPFQGGFGGGAIAIYLRNGKTANKTIKLGDPLPALSFSNLKGYDSSDLFKNVNYQNISLDQLPNDARTTLFWNPNLSAKKGDVATVGFYNNDVAKTFNITILGYDEAAGKFIYFHENVAP